MAIDQVVSVATEIRAYKLLTPMNATGALSGDDAWAWGTSLPADNTTGSGGPNRIVLGRDGALPLADGNTLVLSPFAKKNGGGRKTAKLKVWGVREVPADGPEDLAYRGVLLAKVDLEFGNASGTGGEFGAETFHFADTVNPEADASNTPPGIRAVGCIVNAAGEMLLDALGYKYFIIELLRETAQTDKVGFMYAMI